MAGRIVVVLGGGTRAWPRFPCRGAAAVDRTRAHIFCAIGWMAATSVSLRCGFCVSGRSKARLRRPGRRCYLGKATFERYWMHRWT